ncbi:LamG-like jellyroll fold domain-containing protein [Saccharicrinis sp. GN24d3]|uniref:LamG-like jellyroll fold domain-containing protein n=1 Tax=Saccharicrinis sp. GN24d3 TaxID=3458416 RepID=UPI0040358875
MKKNLLMFTLMLFASVMLKAQSTTPVFHYKFDGNLEDASANSNDAVKTGTVAYGTGIDGQGIVFTSGVDNTTSHTFTLQTPAGLLNPATDDFTLCGWIKIDATAGVDEYVMVHQAPGSGQRRSFLFVSETTGTFGYLGSFIAGENSYSESAINPGEWTYVALRSNHTTNTVTLTLNAEHTVTTDRTPESCDGAIVFGRHDVGSKFFQGEMDEFRLYKELLTDAELDAIRAQDVPTGISKNELSEKVAVVNPVRNGKLQIQVNGMTGSKLIEVYSLTGQKMMEAIFEGDSFTSDLKLGKGCYLLKITAGGEFVSTKVLTE